MKSVQLDLKNYLHSNMYLHVPYTITADMHKDPTLTPWGDWQRVNEWNRNHGPNVPTWIIPANTPSFEERVGEGNRVYSDILTPQPKFILPSGHYAWKGNTYYPTIFRLPPLVQGSYNPWTAISDDITEQGKVQTEGLTPVNHQDIISLVWSLVENNPFVSWNIATSRLGTLMACIPHGVRLNNLTIHIFITREHLTNGFAQTRGQIRNLNETMQRVASLSPILQFHYQDDQMSNYTEQEKGYYNEQFRKLFLRDTQTPGGFLT